MADRGFGRYLDEAMRDRPHTSTEAEAERETRGRTTDESTSTTDDAAEHRPPTTRRGLGRADATDRGFGRYLPD
ncbi:MULTISPECIES: hypothetical protein [Gordonia]|uniref:Uncharacterized protein n=1 Tax=Gordonia amicalis TaxID=89053 RepID=A0AAE4U050_9ACTN|nr:MULTISPECIES: hypothetical protein [Gordonia]MCZ4577770.1 hypothetical protein [Gordonia amicalis]MCZ4652390.1 hypothetical protein [Gordonia amicalis]MDJ0451235.1 hypothetical protein [Gordonia amicalis]MDV6310594.1 hypothetical protein [Gordonia amicalis]MDV7074617.1 hypothetical protein [Gordonia amicalis]